MNYMEKTYNDKKFNSYERGPGASLSAQRSTPNQKLMLCIRNVPHHFDEKKLTNWLKQKGSISNVNKSKAGGAYYFAECPTENDFESILRGTQNNDFNIKVGPKLDKDQNNQNSTNTISPINNYDKNDSNALNRNEIDFTRRSLKGPFNKIQHPQLGNQLNKGLNSNNGLDEHRSRRNNRNNRSRMDMLKETFASSSSGNYDSQKECFTKPCDEVNLLKLKRGPCHVCKKSSTKVCEKCDEFYCSIECQTKDWEKHRHVCFKMPKLISTEAIDANDESNNKVPEKRSIEKNNMSINELKTLGKTNTKESDSMQKYQFPKQTSNSSAANTNGSNTKQYLSPAYLNGNNNDQRPPEKKDNVVKSEMKQFIPPNKNVSKSNDCENNNTILSRVNNVEFADTPKSGQTVLLTHYGQTDMVYVRSLKKCDDTEYLKILQEVLYHSKQSKHLTRLPKVGDYVVAEYDGVWFRSIILEIIDENNIKISCVDFGNIESKKLSELKELPQSCYSLKRYPIQIYLKNVENRLPNEPYMKYMDSLVDNSVQLKITYNSSDLKNEKIFAELWEFSTNENVNNKCVELLKPVPHLDSEEPFFYDDLAKEYLPDEENISVIILDMSLISCGLVSCIAYKYCEELDRLNLELKEYAEKNNDYYTPRENEMCIAKINDGVWYRANCFEVVGDGNPTLYCIDYGNLTPINIKNIRKYPKSFTLPCRTHEYLIAGLEKLLNDEKNLGEKIGTRLQQLMPMYEEVTISKVEKVGENYIIHLPEIIQVLKNEGLMDNL